MSAYDDVDYFKSAFKVNALDYILKPIDTEELLSVMDKVKRRLDMENEERKGKELIKKQMEKNMSFLRSRFFSDLVEGVYKDLKGLEERMEFLQLSLKETMYYTAVMISLDGKQAAYNGSDPAGAKALDFGVLNLLEELIEVYGEGYAFEYEKGDFVLLFKGTGILSKQVEDLTAAFLKILKNGTKIRATVGIGNIVYGIAGIADSFHKAKENVRKRIKLYFGESCGISIVSEVGKGTKVILRIGKEVLCE